MANAIEPPFVWYQLPSSTFCALKGLQNVPDQYEIKEGKSRAQGFPADAFFDMDPRYKKQVAVADNVYNMDRMAVVSPKLKAVVEAFGAKNLEFLPVEIRDHKGKPVKEQFHIMNVLSVVDCLDRDASSVEWNVIDPELVSDIFSLALSPEAMDPSLAFFRVKHLSTWIFVRADVAATLAEAGFSGFELKPLNEFTV